MSFFEPLTVLNHAFRAAIVLGLMTSVVAAQPGGAADRPERAPLGQFCSMVAQPGQVPRLVVDYPWAVHKDVSLEIRLVTAAKDVNGDPVDPADIHPMFFRAEWMHGERLVEVTKRLHHLERSDVTRRIPVADRIEQPELIAWRNHLGRWAVAAVELFAREVNKDEDIVLHGEEAIPGLAMALPWLDQWSLGPKRLVVDLPASEFSKSGWMRVWLLREGTPIWRQDLPWPGTGRKTVAGGDGEK